jgi:hypothetical protein
VTQLVEDITIKITLNHCEGDSTVLGAKNDLRASAVNLIAKELPSFINSRLTCFCQGSPGISVTFVNTGLYEAPETGGGDN